MSPEHITPRNPRIRGAVAELQGLIRAHFPEATFEVSRGEDPEGVYLTATVDTDDLTTVLEVVGDRLVDLQVEQGLPLYVVPSRPLTRALRELQQPRSRRGLHMHLEGPVSPAQP